ncbi:MAG: nucleotidyltransferase domain-containing protein [Acidimicrobiales bacterium]
MALAVREVVDGKARFDGRLLAEWVPEAVEAVVGAVEPISVVLSGSVARGDDGPDSDIDLLVVVDDHRDRHQAAVSALRAVSVLPPEIDVVVVSQESAEAHRDVAGTIIRPALREGNVVYSRGPRGSNRG